VVNFTGAGVSEVAARDDDRRGISVAGAGVPVGAVFIAVGNQSATLLGYGTWSAFGAGECWSGSARGLDFNTVEEVGGAKT
jgi:hypothetical protein